MKSASLFKTSVIAFGIALVTYIAFFSCDRHLRLHRGAWVVTFAVETNGQPAIIVNQPVLRVTNLRIVLGGEKTTNTPGTVTFNIPEQPVPFGRVKFEDLTYLPGTVTLDLFGHEIELLPRTLIVNRKERPWQSETNIELSPADKVPGLTEPNR